MFDFSKSEKIILIALLTALFIGTALSFYLKSLKQIAPVLIENSVGGKDLKSSDEIIRRYSVININTAGQDELTRLSGIGPALAQKIIDYRKTRGKFLTKEDLLKVSGIGGAIFKSLEKSIIVE